MAVDVEQQLVNVLNKLEKYLNSSSSAAPKQPNKAKVAGGVNKDDAVLTNRVRGTAKALDGLSAAVDGADKKFSRLNKTLLVTISNFTSLNRSMRGRPTATTATAAPSRRTRQPRTQAVTPNNPNAPAASPAQQAIQQQLAPLQQLGAVGQLLNSRFGHMAKAGGLLAAGFSSLALLVERVGLPVFKDAFMLQARGIDAQENLVDFYIAAGRAGMNLEEYTTLLEENTAAVARSSSFEDFTKRIDVTGKQLQSLGIFGAAGRKLSATMESSAVALGVPQAQFGSVMEAQIKMFGDLRKSTMLTSDGFKELIQDLAANENVQGELLGMAPKQRAARINELAQISALGYQMGLTKEQSKALSAAFLEQRKATAPDRFKGAGVIQMGAGIAGLSSSEGAELARFAKRKNPPTDPKELKRYQELAAKFQAGLEQRKNSGDIAQENIAEQIEGLLPGSLSNILKVSGQAELTKDSGPVINKQFGDNVGTFGQKVGEFAVAVTGFAKSPLYAALTSLGPLFAGIVGLLALKKGGALLNAANQSLPKAGGRLGVISRVLGGAGALAAPAAQAGTTVAGTAAATTATTTVAATSAGTAASTAAASIGGFTKALMMVPKLLAGSALIGGLVSAIEEAFTGELAAAIGTGRIGGVIFGAFNGLFTGMSRLFDGAINWVFEGLGMTTRVNTTKFFDYATLTITEGWTRILAAVISSISWGLEKVTGLFGLKAPWVKSLDETAAGLNASADNMQKTRVELWKKDGATLRSEGEKKIKDQEKIAATTKAQADKISTNTDKVVQGLDALIPSAQNTVRLAQDQAFATPGPTNRAQVTPPEVNTSTASNSQGDAAAEDKIVQTSSPEMVALMQQQVAIQRQILSMMIENPNSLTPSIPRPRLPDNADTTAAYYAA